MNCQTTYSQATLQKYKDAMDIVVGLFPAGNDPSGAIHNALVGTYNLLDRLQKEQELHSQEQVNCSCALCQSTRQYR